MKSFRTWIGDELSVPEHILDKHPTWQRILEHAPKIEYSRYDLNEDGPSVEDGGKVAFLVYIGAVPDDIFDRPIDAPQLAEVPYLAEETGIYQVGLWWYHAQRLSDSAGPHGVITRVEYRLIVRLRPIASCPHCGQRRQ